MMAMEYCGMRLEDSDGVQAGMLLTSSSSAKGVSRGGPTSGSGSSGSSRSSSSSSSSKSSSFFWTGFHQEHRPCDWRTEEETISIIIGITGNYFKPTFYLKA